MAFIPMNSGSGGGLTETTLWTNPSPTSAMTSGTLITLSDDYTNYDYLKFTYRVSTTIDTEWDVVIPKDSVTDAIYGLTNNNRISLSYYGSSYLTIRVLGRSNSTTARDFKATDSRQWGGAGTSTTFNIPTKISGLKQ